MYLVGLHIYYKMIHGPYNVKLASNNNSRQQTEKKKHEERSNFGLIWLTSRELNGDKEENNGKLRSDTV